MNIAKRMFVMYGNGAVDRNTDLNVCLLRLAILQSIEALIARFMKAPEKGGRVICIISTIVGKSLKINSCFTNIMWFGTSKLPAVKELNSKVKIYLPYMINKTTIDSILL